MNATKLDLLLQTVVLLFLTITVTVVFADNNRTDSKGPSLFSHPELVEEKETEQAPTMEELDELVDELEIQFDLFMIEVFKGFTEVYLPSKEQHSELEPDQFAALVKERRALMDKWCTPGIDADNNLFSLKCRDYDQVEAPLKVNLGHPVYKNLLVSINRHSLLTNLKEGKDRIRTSVTISQMSGLYLSEMRGKPSLTIGTHTAFGETLGVRLRNPKLYCRILSFDPLTIDNFWSAEQCAKTLQESIAVLERLNRDL